MSETSSLTVYLHGKRVGQLIEFSETRNIFVFDKDYIANPENQILGLGFKTVDGGIDAETKVRNTKIDPYFSNLLPEGKLRDYVAAKSGINPEREFELLKLMGEDLPGALVITPADAKSPELDLVPEDAKRVLVDENASIKFSLAGVQMKLSAFAEANGGLTIPASGRGGNWIVKFQSETFSMIPENEFAVLDLARRFGLDVPETQMISVGDIRGLPEGIRPDLGPALAIRRFDRTAAGRIHMEDFAQVFRIYPHNKYRKANFDMIGRVIFNEIGEAGLIDFIDRLVFTIGIGNGDMHAKNWSLLYQDGKANLAPVYDYLSTLTYIQNENMGLNLIGNKEFNRVDLTSFRRFAAKIEAPESLVVNAAQEAATKLNDVWASNKKDIGLPDFVRYAIEKNLGNTPLFKA